MFILILLACSTDEPIRGCTVSCATNYDPTAEEDDGSCRGCTDITATNFCLSGLTDDGSCIPQCEANGTAEIYFINKSNTNSTYDIIWNGVKIATVAPGQESERFTVAATVQHTLVFKLTNTGDLACTASTPVLSQCAEMYFDCTG